MPHLTNVARVITEARGMLRTQAVELSEAEILLGKLETEGLGTPALRSNLNKTKRRLESLKRITQ